MRTRDRTILRARERVVPMNRQSRARLQNTLPVVRFRSMNPPFLKADTEMIHPGRARDQVAAELFIYPLRKKEATIAPGPT